MGMEVTFYDLPVVEVELPGYLHIGIPGETGATFIPSVSEDGILSWENDKNLENPHDTDLKLLLEMAAEADLAQIRQDIADLQYVPIDITSVSNSVGMVEIGVTVEEVTISWAANKRPTGQDVNGEQVETDARELTLTGLSLAGDTAFTVTAVDERGAEDQATTKVLFRNGVYYGSVEYGSDIDSEVLLGLSRKIQSGRGVSFTVSEQRPVYACPSQYGTPKFTIGGFEYEWEKEGTIDFTNASGYTEPYDVWVHSQDVAGIMTIHVT